MIDPHAPLSKIEQAVFGATERDPVTGIPFEIGSGAFPREIQAALYAQAAKDAAAFRPIKRPPVEDEA
jgi:hypothetical protein